MKENVEAFCKKYAVERRGSGSLKWDALEERFGNKDLLAMWVADMEFMAPEEVREALVKKAAHGAFGYSLTPDEYYETILDWHKKRHQIEVKKEWLRFSHGVVSAVYYLVNAFTEPEDRILILTPLYYPFRKIGKDTGRKVVQLELLENSDGSYDIDFEAFERKIIEENVKIFIQCSPHNPIGRVWSEEELKKVMDICLAHNVLVVSDEIHQDITRPGVEFFGALRMGEEYYSNLIVVNAATKTFNLAALLHSQIFIPDEKKREIYDTHVRSFQHSDSSIFGIEATKAAYQHGEEWLDAFLEVLDYNFKMLKNILNEQAPLIQITELQGTYLAWLDLRQYLKAEQVEPFMQDVCGLAINYGEWFGEQAKGFIRINLATEPRYVKYAAEVIAEKITDYQKEK